MLTKLRKRPKGSILLLVLFLLIVLAMMGSAFSILLPVEMQNAKRDRANIQTAYAADAAVLWVMDELDANDDLREDNGWDDLEGTTQVLSKEWEWRVAEVDRLDGNEAYRVVTEGIRVRGSQRDVLRRAVAIIDNAWIGETAAVINLATPGGSSPMGSNANTFWPGNVPIYGDAIVLGTWSVDDSLFDTSGGPIYTGTITQTDNSGSGLRGEEYKNTALTTEQYDEVYTNGVNGVQTGDVGDVDDLYMTAADARRNMQKYLFSTSDETVIDDMNDTVLATTGVHIPLNNDGVPNGGFIFNDGGGNGAEYDVLFSVDPNGNSVMNYSNADSVSSINTIQNDDPTNPTEVSTAATGTSFQVIHVMSGSQYGPEGEQRLVIKDSGGTVIYNQQADFSGGIVTYNVGAINVEGTFAGEKTVGATLGVTITGELLKDGLPRNMTTSEALADGSGLTDAEKERVSNSLLGLVCNVDANNASQGFRFNVAVADVPADGELNIHSSLMGSSKTDVNAKMFGNNIGHVLNGAEVVMHGQLATPQTNAGQYKKELEFIRDSMKALYSDSVPIGFPTNIEGFTPRLRAYVDQQSFDTD